MQLKDHRGYKMSGAEPVSIEHFEEALRLFQGWRTDPLPVLERAVALSPSFVMARVLSSYILLCSRDPRNVPKARQSIDALAQAPANERERWHLAILGALIAADYETAQARLSALLDRYPRDVLALQVAHAFDYLLGNTRLLRDRVAHFLPHFPEDLPGHPALATMYAFGLAENGHFSRAVDWGMHALERDPGNPRAHHAIAHVHEMSSQFLAGWRWLANHVAHWSQGSTVANHCWWHLALFCLRSEDPKAALDVYDQPIRSRQTETVADLIDASSLLWRLTLEDHSAGRRWDELADKWTPRVWDGFCAFNDMHAMMAFAAAGRWRAAASLIENQALRARQSDTNAMMTRLVGLPACRGILAYGRGHYAEAADLLSRLPEIAYRLGGSNAQHGVIALTHAAARVRASAFGAGNRKVA